MSSALTAEQEIALAAAADELDRNYAAAEGAVFGTLWFDSAAFESAKASLNGSAAAIALLRGELLEAARGFRAWPLDDASASIDSQGALGAWQQLAGSVRGALDGIKNYTADWSALATLSKVGSAVGSNIAIGSSVLLVAALVIAGLVLFAKVAR